LVALSKKIEPWPRRYWPSGNQFGAVACGSGFKTNLSVNERPLAGHAKNQQNKLKKLQFLEKIKTTKPEGVIQAEENREENHIALLFLYK
jgi:hypothetical protein